MSETPETFKGHVDKQEDDNKKINFHTTISRFITQENKQTIKQRNYEKQRLA